MRALAVVLLLAVLVALFAWTLMGEERAAATARAVGVQAPAADFPAEVALVAPPVEAILAEPATPPAVDASDARPVAAELYVVDERTGQAVPEVAIDVAGLRLVTDVVGRATTSEPLPAGTLRARVIDAGVTIAEREKEWSGSGRLLWTLRVPIGPTYELVLASQVKGARLEDWSARLVESPRAVGVAGVLRVVHDTLEVAHAELPDRPWVWQHPRGGGRAWIRYPKLEHEPDARLAPRVVVRAEGWADVAIPVPATVGVHGPLLVPLAREVGGVAGHVRDEEGDPVAGATVLLVPAGDPPEGRTPVWEHAFTGADGGFRFERVAAGAHRLVVSKPVHPVVTRDVSVRPEGVALGVVSSKLSSSPGIRVVSSRETGDAWDDSVLVLRAGLVDAIPYGWLFAIEEGGGGPDRTHVTLPHLPAGDYAVGQVCIGGPPRFRPYGFLARATSRFDANHLEPDVRPIGPSELRSVRFDVTDARDGSVIARSFVFCGPEGTVYLRYGDLKAGTPLRLPPDAPFTWTVAAQGYAPAHGDQDDVRTEGGEGVVRVALHGGWGASLFFRAGDPATFEGQQPGQWHRRSENGLLAAPPLPAVGVEADGEALEASDANGAVRISRGAAPLWLTLRCEGWRLAAVERTGSGPDDRHVVWMTRE
jgi:hypothetical protein